VDEGDLTVASGAAVHYLCAGHGKPAILLEAGIDSGGTEQFVSSFVDPLAGVTQVCTYDRLGTGSSSGAETHGR
jgi:hypothetical protein